MSDREKQVRDRAYALWEAEGSPHGRDRDHWEQAELELGGAAPGEGSVEQAPANEGQSAQTAAEGGDDLPVGGANSPEPTPAAVTQTNVAASTPAEGATDAPKRRTRKKAAN